MKEYLDTIKALLKDNKTTGSNHSEDMLHYSTMNIKRLERWLAKGEINSATKDAIKAIKAPQKWLVITEAWCGDAAHSLGFIAKMAALNPIISFEWKWRDENLALMDQFLTNGARSIPKLIVYNEKEEVLFDWGPRPETIQNEFLKMKAENIPYAEMSVSLQKLYNSDKGVTIQSEIIAKLKESN